MSDQIPFHIQEEIMKRLPVKSLVRFRCVSKPWKSLIDSSRFIAAHSLRRHTQTHHLLVLNEMLVLNENPAAVDDHDLYSQCYIDDDTFPQHRSVPTLPLSVKQLTYPKVVGSSQGLFCIHGYDSNLTTPMAIVWNPSIRKSIVVCERVVDFDVCPATGYSMEPYIGFGVCPVNSDPKIVAITQSSKAMVYTLSSGKWKTLSSNLPTKRFGELLNTVAVDGFIYWNIAVHDRNMITSFDLTSEIFKEIDLPDNLGRDDGGVLQIIKLRESLALVQYDEELNLSTVWMFDHGAFTKLYIITTLHDCIVGFRKNGIPIVKVTEDDYEVSKLVVYEPNSQHNNVAEICNAPFYFNMYPYMETLLLLDRSDYSS